MTLRTGLLKALEPIRSMLDTGLDWRRYDIVLRTIQWTGSRPGLGDRVVVDTPIVHANSNARVKVERLSGYEIAASGGKYVDGDIRVGPITPSFDGGGRDVSFFDPDMGDPPLEIYFKVTGPGSEGGRWYKLHDRAVGKNLRYEFVLRAVNVDVAGLD